MRIFSIILLVLSLFLVSCSAGSDDKKYPSGGSKLTTSIDDMALNDAPGTLQITQANIILDYSHTSDGYIAVKKSDTSDLRYKIRIIKDEEYTYDILGDDYNYYPLQMGDGTYQINVFKQVNGDNYAYAMTASIDAALSDPLAPFLHASQIVNYNKDSEAVIKGFELTKGDTLDVERIYHIYNYIITKINYDDDKAKKAQDSFMLPDVDETLNRKEGICFDYAALMSAMLRSQNIPTRLITGYTSDEYHSWVEIWMEKDGWITPELYLKKHKWTLVDPTFGAQGKEYKGKYQKKYIY